MLLALVLIALAAFSDADASEDTPWNAGPSGGRPLEAPPIPGNGELPPIGDSRLPPVEQPPDAGLSSGLAVYVRRFEITGNTVFADAELAGVTAPFEGRVITGDELQQVRYLLTRYYVDRGYINSGVVIPDQRVEDGVIRLSVVEGRLGEVEPSGNRRLRDRWIIARLESPPGEVLNLDVLHDRLQLLQQADVVDRIDADLQPGVVPGQARLDVEVEEANPWLLSFVVSNNRPPSVGAMYGEIFAGHRNVTGNADSLTARIGLTEGSNDGGLYYNLPLGAGGTELFAGANQSNSSVLQQPFASLDVDSELDTYWFGLRHAFLRTLSDTATIELSLDLRSSLTKLLGRPFSFSEGVRDGQADVTVVRYSQSWLRRGFRQVIVARSTLRLGIDAFGATINERGPDGEFLAWFGQFQWARRVGDGHQINLRSDLQLAGNPLLPLEQCAIGGADSVRGYRVNQLVRDNCFVASIEYRVPLFRLRLPKISQGPEDGTIRLAPFFDFGAAWNTDRQDVGPDTLPSLGVGLRWDPSPKLHADVYWGYAFQDFVVQGNDLQDDGISFRIEWNVF